MASTLNLDILNQLKEILGDDLSLVLDSFLDEGAEVIQKIETGMAQEDLNSIREAAHSMKSMAGNIGAMELSDVADQLQIVAASNDLEASKSLWEKFQELYVIVVGEVRDMN